MGGGEGGNDNEHGNTGISTSIGIREQARAWEYGNNGGEIWRGNGSGDGDENRNKVEGERGFAGTYEVVIEVGWDDR